MSKYITTYKGSAIELSLSGWYSAMVLVGDTRTGYYQIVKSDTLAGIKESIRALLTDK